MDSDRKVTDSHSIGMNSNQIVTGYRLDMHVTASSQNLRNQTPDTILIFFNNYSDHPKLLKYS